MILHILVLSLFFFRCQQSAEANVQANGKKRNHRESRAGLTRKVSCRALRCSWKRSDRDYHIDQQLNLKETHSLNDIVTFDSTTIISGIAGIGKSHVAEEISYRWARGQILENMDTLFLIRCREFNGMVCSSMQDILIDLNLIDLQPKELSSEYLS